MFVSICTEARFSGLESCFMFAVFAFKINQ